MRISRKDWDELVAHTLEDAPEECCGYARVKDGMIEEVVRGRNDHDSKRYGFDLDGRSLAAANFLEDDGYGVAIYHSHPRSPAVPSEQDRNVVNYPHWLYLIVSPVDEPKVRAWWLRDGKVEEEPLEVE
jgi:proteasome lid subunit RPN8/RPN11